MKSKEFQRLMGYWRAKVISNSHKPSVTTRRHNKRVANGSGMILKNSSIKSEVHLETVFQYQPARLDRILAQLPCIVTTRKEQNEERRKNERMGND